MSPDTAPVTLDLKYNWNILTTDLSAIGRRQQDFNLKTISTNRLPKPHLQSTWAVNAYSRKQWSLTNKPAVQWPCQGRSEWLDGVFRAVSVIVVLFWREYIWFIVCNGCVKRTSGVPAEIFCSTKSRRVVPPCRHVNESGPLHTSHEREDGWTRKNPQMSWPPPAMVFQLVSRLK